MVYTGKSFAEGRLGARHRPSKYKHQISSTFTVYTVQVYALCSTVQVYALCNYSIKRFSIVNSFIFLRTLDYKTPRNMKCCQLDMYN